jgi:sulfotransferase
MQKVFLAGLPRSGSTMLAALLSQNPNTKVSEASTLLNLITEIRAFWNHAPRHRSINKADRLIPILKAVFNSYHPNNYDVVIDKHRDWPLYLDLMNKVNESKVKVICTVRNPVEVAASFDRLHIKEPETYTQVEEFTKRTGSTTLDRAKSILSPDGSGGLAFSALYEAAIVQNKVDQMLFVDYHKLCENPQKQLMRIYNFIGMDYFKEHTFESIKPAEQQKDDFIQGYRTLHKIEENVRLGKKDLGRLEQFYDELYLEEFWKEWT